MGTKKTTQLENSFKEQVETTATVVLVEDAGNGRYKAVLDVEVPNFVTANDGTRVYHPMKVAHMFKENAVRMLRSFSPGFRMYWLEKGSELREKYPDDLMSMAAYDRLFCGARVVIQSTYHPAGEIRTLLDGSESTNVLDMFYHQITSIQSITEDAEKLFKKYTEKVQLDDIDALN